MSEEKQIEQAIGWYKVVFTILSAIDISLFAWFVQHYASESLVLLFVCAIGIISVTVIIVTINKHVIKLLNRLREL